MRLCNWISTWATLCLCATAFGQTPIYRVLDRPLDGVVQPAGALADLDGDGDVDLLTSEGIYLNDGAARFVLNGAPSPIAQTNVQTVVAADFTGDGLNDLAWIDGAAQVVVAINTPGLTFTFPATPLPLISSGNPAITALSRAIAVGDVDGDGLIDLVVTTSHYVNGTTQNGFAHAWRGLGNGAFADVASAMPATELPYVNVQLSDLDRDGDLDALFEGNFSGSGLQVAVAYNSAGTFSIGSTSLVTSARVSSLDVGEFNGDSIPDVVVTQIDSTTSSSAVIVLGPLSSPSGFTVTSLPRFDDAFVLDVNGDGHGELVTAINDQPAASQVTVRPVSVTGVVGAPIQTLVGYATSGGVGLPTRPRPIDLDGDGDRDLVCVTSGYLRPELLMNSGAGSLTRFPDPVAQIQPLSWITAGNVDQDGVPDILGLDSGSPQRLITGINDGSAYFTPGPTATLPLVLPATAGLIVPFDADGDGDSDVYAPYPPSVPGSLFGPDHLLINQGSSFTTVVMNPSAQGRMTAVALDCDGDGDLDLITAPQGSTPAAGAVAEMLLNLGGNTFGAPIPLGTLHATVSLAVADFTGDGLDDVFQTNGYLAGPNGQAIADNCVVYLRTGPATFNPVTFPSQGYTSACGDVNGDGLADVIVDAGIYLGNGNGTFVLQPQALPGALPFGSRIMDVDADGDRDVVTAHGAAYRNIGNATFAPIEVVQSLGSFGVFGGVTALADFDQDQDLDLVIEGPLVLSNCTRQIAIGQFARPGRPLTVDLYGTPGDLWGLYLAAGTSHIPVPPSGTILLDLATTFQIGTGYFAAGPTPRAGTGSVTLTVPTGNGFVGVTVYAQAFDVTQSRLTNRLPITVLGF